MSRDALELAIALGSATLHEAAGGLGALPCEIEPVAAGSRLAGPAFTVSSAPGDNLWIHRALAVARPGDVLVVDVSGHHEAGYWGEVMSVAALARRLGGLVIDGSVRDADAIEALGFPVFARGLCIGGTGKDAGAPGALGGHIWIGGVTVRPGDLVVGDRDGVVVVPRESASETIERGRERERKEREILERLRAGETTLDVYGWK